jgi:transcriptional regulator with XRE-family HTH domain
MASKIERILDSRGYRRGWFADRLGISDPYLSQLLSGGKRWTDELKEKAALWLGVPADILFSVEECSQELPQTEPETTA